jgi:hypothetical protein
MHKILIDSIAFAYGVDYAELRATLSNTTLLPQTEPAEEECSKATTPTLFSQR